MAVTLRMGGKNELALKASSYARLLSFLALQWERIRLWVCVPVWNNVGDSKKTSKRGLPQKQNTGHPPPPSPCSQPLWFFLFSSSVTPLPYCSKRSSHFHSSRIHSFPPLSFVCTPKQAIFRVRWEQRWETKKSKTQLGWSTSQVDVCVIGVMWKPEPTAFRLYANVP